MIAARQVFLGRGGGTPLDISGMTQLEITAAGQNLTYAIRKGVLASGSNSVRIYWDATGDANSFTDYAGGFVDATHTYDTAGDYVVAITDDIGSLSITGGSSAVSFTPNSMMLRRVTTGDKVTTMPSPGGGIDEALYFGNGTHLIEYIDLVNVTKAGRPAWSVKTSGGTLIANNITTIESYGVEGARQWDVYVNSLTNLEATSVNTRQGVNFWFDKPCAEILMLSDVLRPTLRFISAHKFHGTDGYVCWSVDTSSWIVVSN